MNKDHICGFLLGLSAGGGIALLFAPRCGKKTRSQIAQAAAEGVTYVKEYGETVRDTTRGLVERGKEKVAQQKDSVANTINQARDAYEEAVR
jgi:gas vesicle protein